MTRLFSSFKFYGTLPASALLICLACSPETAHAQTGQTKNPPAASFTVNDPSGKPVDIRPPRDIAMEHIRQNANRLGVTQDDLDDLVITDEYTSKSDGVTHVFFQQTVNGLPIVNSLGNVNILPNGSVLNVGNRLSGNIQSRASAKIPNLTAIDAVNRAARHLGLSISSALKETSPGSGISQKTILNKGGISREPITSELVYYEHEGQLRLAWQSLIEEVGSPSVWEIWVDARTGDVIDQANLTADVVQVPSPPLSQELKQHPAIAEQAKLKVSSPPKPQRSESTIQQAVSVTAATAVTKPAYRVIPFPYESPHHPGGAQRMVKEPADPVASPFGWHGLIGANACCTWGNNVFAQEDTDNNNTGGRWPSGGADQIYDFTYNYSLEPTVSNNENALLVNLFYWNNITHDLLYQYGFDEASGNFQYSNYTGDGLGNDYVIADGLDGDGFNNANFSTPPDGSKPRMQMYQYRPRPRIDVINSVTPLQPEFRAGDWMGPVLTESGIRQALRVVTDGTAPFDDGCQALTNSASVSGRIAVIQLYASNACSLATPILNAQNAGAIGVIVINDIDFIYSPPDNNGSITIPAIQTPSVGGALLKEAIAGGTVDARLSRNSVNRDSDFDNEIIVHEYGHGVSNRLTGGPSKHLCLQNEEQMGEGWSDFLSLVLTDKSGANGATPRGHATYASHQGPNGPGNRHYRYSTDLAVSPVTYDSIKTTNLPHGLGEVWAAMLWEVYWNLVDRYGFNPDLYQDWQSGGNNLALQLVMNGMKLQGCSPGFVSGRDAILAADLALTGGVNQCDIWKGFAKRGLGWSATQGSTNDVSDGVEKYDLPPSCRLIVTRPDDPVPGACSPGDCSLREAIRAANAQPGLDTIQFESPGVYFQQITGINENAALTGDFDITDDVVILGHGINDTIISGALLDRVFEVHGKKAYFRGLRILLGQLEAGSAGFQTGAGVRNVNGTVNMEDVVVQSNSINDTGGFGGGAGIASLFSNAQLELNRVLVFANLSSGYTGIYNQEGVVSIRNSTISGNIATGYGVAGIMNQAANGNPATTSLEQVTIASNTSSFGNASGIFNATDGSASTTMNISRSIIADNGTDPNCLNWGSINSLGYNVTDDSSCTLDGPGDRSNVTDAGLVGLDTQQGKSPGHSLNIDSPARGIVPPAERYFPQRDQRGVTRPMEEFSDAGAIEAGACERDDYGYEMCPIDGDFVSLLTPVRESLTDDSFIAVPLPFTFKFYGTAFDQVFIGSNGILTFGSGSASRIAQNLPDASAAPNNLIAAWWEDLNPTAGNGVIEHSLSPEGDFVIEFRDVEHYGGGNPSSFQVRLFSDGQIEVNYQVATDDGTHAAGIESADGLSGLSFHYDERAIPFGAGVRYTPPSVCKTDSFGYQMCRGSGSFNYAPVTDTTDVEIPDDGFINIPLPYPFTFYGVTYNDVNIESNGYLTFGEGSGSSLPQKLPNSAPPNNLIATWWTDLDPNLGNGFIRYGLTSQGDFVIQSQFVQHFPSGAASSFQVRLFPDSSIEMNFQVNSDGGIHSAGIENADGTSGLSFYYDSPSLPFPSNVRFTPPIPGVAIVHSTNGADANTPPGVGLAVGEQVNWSYEVTNTGGLPLLSISVTDSNAIVVNCPTDTLDVGEEMTCTASGNVIAGQYASIGSVSAFTAGGQEVTDSDPSYYFGLSDGIDIEKYTNGQDADNAPGPSIAAGETVTWTYVVTNSGTVRLNDISVEDDDTSIVVSCPENALAAGAQMTCTGSQAAIAGQYQNLGRVSGNSELGNSLSDSDLSHYFGSSAAIDIEKLTNGFDADGADDPDVPVVRTGFPVIWEYNITNTGNEPLSNISVTDDQIGPINCPETSLQVGESMTCSVRGQAVAGPYANLGEVVADPPTGLPVSASDPSHYFGADPSIDIEKYTNGEDADTPIGPNITVDDPVNWSYVVTNTGNVELTNVVVTDDQVGTPSCPKSILRPGEEMTCSASGTAESGQYVNLGQVTASAPVGPDVSDSDLSHYYGGELSDEIFINGFENDNPVQLE